MLHFLFIPENKWNKGLLYIKEQIEKVAGAHFNSVLMNWYRDGEDSFPNASPAVMTYTFKKQLRGSIGLDDVNLCVTL